MREIDLVRVLERWAAGEVTHALATLADSGQAQLVTRYGERFWSNGRAHYARAARDMPS
jgi:hypothetical protein